MQKDINLELGEYDVETKYFDRGVLHYFPLFYLLPEKYLQNHSWLDGFPRNPHLVLKDELCSYLFDSDQMRQLIMETYAEKIWPYLGVRGNKEDYNLASLSYRICYQPILLANALKSLGYTVRYVLSFTQDSHVGIDYWTEEEFDLIMSVAVPLMLRQNDFMPLVEVDKKTRCIEDFDHSKRSFVQKDFYRKWYHTRSRHSQTSLDTLITKDGERHPMDFPDPQQDFEEKSLSKAVIEVFKEQISQKDMQILKLRMEGYTYEEIAKKLGYKNHSGVLKRIRKITEQYKDFHQKYGT